MEKRCVKKGDYLSNESVGELNDVHGWFQYSDAQSHVSRAFANNAIHQFIESGKEAEQVKDETGLTPRQLAEQRAELLAALKVLTDRIGYYASLAEDDAPNIEQWAYTDQSSDVANARALIAKAEARS